MSGRDGILLTFQPCGRKPPALLIMVTVNWQGQGLPETLIRVAPPRTTRLRHRSYKHRWCEKSSNEAPPAFDLVLGRGTEAVARGNCCLRARMSEVCTAQTVITRARSSISKSSIVQNKADCSNCHGVTVYYVLQLSLCALHA